VQGWSFNRYLAVSGSVSADVLVNTTSVGMHPAEDESPVAASALSQFSVVFDAIYTPLETQLLKVGTAAPGSPALLKVLTLALCDLAAQFGGVHHPQQSNNVLRTLAILLQDARAAGCTPISGLEMFVGQAADQFKLFTGKDAPEELMRQTVLDSLAKQ
jgi:shikimate 5-dehydrogenase